MDFAKRIIENPGKYFEDSFVALHIIFQCNSLVIFRLKREEQSLSNIRKYSLMNSFIHLILFYFFS